MSYQYHPSEDDDGRTIADMSSLEQPRIFPLRKKKASEHSEREGKHNRPWEPETPFSKEDRRAYVLAAVASALLIAAVFLAGLGVVIWLITCLA